MTDVSRKPRRAGGRAARVARRTTNEVEVNPCPPGQNGGAYKPLSDPDLAAIYGTALRILAEIGMGEVPDALMTQALEKGAEQNALGRLCFPRSMVEGMIDGARKSFVLHGRDQKHDIEIGGDRVYFGTGGAAVQTLDLETGLYRPSTLIDLYDFTRLADTLTNISWFTRCCVATDLEDILDLDINTVYALLAGTTKPIGTSITIGEHVDPIVDMFDMAAGGEGKFREKPFCKAHISPVISPLRYGEDAFEVALRCIDRGMPINAIIAGQAGATGPAAPAAMLAQTTAEALAALAMVHVFSPGYPMIFSNWPFVVDLRTGAFAGSGGEMAVMNAAVAQIARFLGLPGGVASSMADAKAVDAQMGAEKALTALATGLAGGNMIYESSGMMASLLGASFEAFVADDEMLSHVYRAIRGIEVTEETLGFDAILGAVTGEGHFLGADHTMAAMQRDYFYPSLADRDDPLSWAENGALSLWERAGGRAKNTLSTHFPTYLDAATDARIRDRFDIRLEENRMRAASTA
ncbi:MAG: trimethylamine methyltransferase family protein [Geminicoccaceae bacterium]